VKGGYENIFIILYFKRSDINTMWKSLLKYLLSEAGGCFQNFCTKCNDFFYKKIW